MISLDQHRAKLAWTHGKQVQDRGIHDKYYSLIRSFPAMIQSVGIGQAVAFLMSRAENKEHSLLLDHLREWLFDPYNSVPWAATGQSASPSSLLERLLQQDPAVWWYADEEAIAYATWLKRYSEYFDGLKKLAAAKTSKERP